MTVTVCIPAYRAGAFIAATLLSVMNQTWRDLKVVIAIDPADPDHSHGPDTTRAAVEPFLMDPRFSVTENPFRLGWAGNIRAMLSRVDTEFYAILPHDDLWDPNYVEEFVGVLLTREEITLAYGDLTFFGAVDPSGKAVLVPDTEDRLAQVLAFLLEGAEAMPWRGVTRSRMIARVDSFPVDLHLGFAVECEYALAHLMEGRILRRPRTLYYKRIFPSGTLTASSDRVRSKTDSEKLTAWAAHSERMRCLVEPLRTQPSGHLILKALTAAMLRRWQSVFGYRLDHKLLVRAQRGLQELTGHKDDASRAVAARLALVLSRHQYTNGQVEEAERLAQVATETPIHGREACLWRALLLLSANKPFEILGLLDRVEREFPFEAGTAVPRAQSTTMLAEYVRSDLR